MTCANCQGENCKRVNSKNLGRLTFVAGLDEHGCERYDHYSAVFPTSSKLVANADGSFTFVPGDGSASVTIPKECCPTMSKTGNTVTFTNGDGSIISFSAHQAATFTQTAAPFAWNSATQSGNVPQSPSLIANVDGSFTFTAGDGSAPVVIPEACCPTMTIAGNIITFTNGDGTVISFPIHPAATLTNNVAPFTWNSATQVGNIPHGPTLTLTATGFTFTPGDGGSAVDYVQPANVSDTFVSGFTIVGNVATITRNDGVVFTQTLPTLIDINVQSFTLSGSTLTLTETDGATHTVTIPAEVKVSAVSFVPATGLLTVTNSDGTAATVTLNICAALQVLPDGTVGTPNITQVLGKDCKWRTLPPVDNCPGDATDIAMTNFIKCENGKMKLATPVSAAPCALPVELIDPSTGLIHNYKNQDHTSIRGGAFDSAAVNIAALAPAAGLTVGVTSRLHIITNTSQCRPMNVFIALEGRFATLYPDGTVANTGIQLSVDGAAFATVASEQKGWNGALARFDHHHIAHTVQQIPAGGSISVQLRAYAQTFSGALQFDSAGVNVTWIGVTV